MKNLLDYGVQEMNAEEKVNVGGGWTQTYWCDGVKYTDWRRWENGVAVTYRKDTWHADGTKTSSFIQSGQGQNGGADC